jgi:asparagine synthase (glutamine-hydrolysing)
MSGFVLIYQRDGTPVEAATLGHMMASLKHRGPDGHQLSCHEAVALGHHHFWTTPEEVGECQPLWTTDRRFGLVFDGRLDNRDELLRAMRMEEPGLRQSSDAAIILRAYEQWAEESIARLLGPFALAIYDTVRQRVVCARDPLGDRSLCYYLDECLLLVASEEQALLAHPAVPGELDETTLAYFFAVRAPIDGRTFFEGVHELLPAHNLIVTRDTVQNRRYWAVNPEARLDYRSDTDYGDRFRELLDRSVRRCLRAVGRPAIMMSGGLDSTSIAALAARQLAASTGPNRLCTISWVFDNFPDCDERNYMDPLIARYNFKAIRVNGDGDWPFRDPFPSGAYNASYPYVDPYHLLKFRLYKAARTNHVRVLLTGVAGDELYTGAENWLLDLLLEHRFIEAGNELLRASRNFGLANVLTSQSLRRVAGRLFDSVPGARRHLRTRNKRKPDKLVWLTPYARRHLPEIEEAPASATLGRRPDQHWSILGMYGVLTATIGFSQAAQFDIETRQPYRDRQLVEFMLAIPAHQLYKRQCHKYILRNAMTNLLPANILNRVGPTSLLPFYRFGLMQRSWQHVQTLLNNPGARWRDFVLPEWIEVIAWQSLDNGQDGPVALLPWRSLSLEQWLHIRNRVINE